MKYLQYYLQFKHKVFFHLNIYSYVKEKGEHLTYFFEYNGIEFGVQKKNIISYAQGV